MTGRYFTIIVLFLEGFYGLRAQIPVLGEPVSPFNCAKPFDRQKMPSETQKSKDQPWIVISDRNDNPTYDKPGGNVFRTIKFRSYFYVTEETEEWIRIAQGAPNLSSADKGGSLENKHSDGLMIFNHVDCGWIRKENMLLWRGALLNKFTGFRRRVMCFNNIKGIGNLVQYNESSMVSLYNSPVGIERLDNHNLTLNEVLFVYKVENDRLLIGPEYLMNKEDIETSLTGWVEERRCANLSRLYATPNFEKRAFEERKIDPRFDLILYSNAIDAEQHAREGKPPLTKKIINFHTDEEEWLTTSHNYNSSLKFPLLQVYDNSARSLIPLDIVLKSEATNLSLVLPKKEKLKVSATEKQKYNLVFVIEGSKEMSHYKSKIINTINSVISTHRNSKDINIGILIYSSSNRGKEGETVVLKPLTPILDLPLIDSFIQQTSFVNMDKKSEYIKMYYEINEAISRLELMAYENNIIFLLGTSPDESTSNSLIETTNSNTRVSGQYLIEKLSNINAHFYVLQYENTSPKLNRLFLLQSQFILLNNAKMQYNSHEKRYANIPHHDL